MTHPARTFAAATLAALLGACSMTPAYHPPALAPLPAAFKELPGWRSAEPADAVARGAWWQLFGDPELDALEGKVLVSNQNLAAAKAAYDQAAALVRQRRAAMMPALSATTQTTESRTFEGAASTGPNGSTGSTGTTISRPLSGQIGATWAIDLWGALGDAVRQSGALRLASAGDLANATLAAQGQLAQSYVELRGLDAQREVLATTIEDYTRALDITSNRYKAGVAARSDLLQAETILHNAQAQAADLTRQRTLLEHAIAVLAGENPSTFTIAPRAWTAVIPQVPAVVPSDLLERRPDIAAAERRVAAANFGIGVQRAAGFPSLSLTGGVGSSGRNVSSLFSAPSAAWSLGLSGLTSIFDFGAYRAKVASARAAHEQAVATYRQTVLTAFQQTEDQLAASRLLETEAAEAAAAARSANQAEIIARNQYLAGTLSYANVIVAQTTALSARTAQITADVNRQVAAIALIEAIGGRWSS